MRFNSVHSFFYLLFSLACLATEAQVVLTGTITEENGSTLPGATIRVLAKDSSLVTGAVSGANGEFAVRLEPNTKYILVLTHISYFGVKQYYPVSTQNTPVELGKMVLRESKARSLKEVDVVTVQERGKQSGDTTAFNAGAFKTNPDASAEDLIKKMPGVTSDNSGVKVNGETVQKVLVDGKPFFGDDPNAALKNLPADVIDKVEVFDKMSDQAAFTGFNDTDPQKTINIVTKKGKNKGQFGRIYGGGGADEEGQARYQSGLTLNNFKDKQRLSLLLLSNNINQQNFSASDITGALGGSAGNSGRGGGRQGGEGSSSLMTSPQNGNTTTHATGLNYSDQWGKKINVSGSYFYNYGDNRNVSRITRTYFTDDRAIYNQSNNTSNINQNHRVNFRFEYNIDSSNKLTIVPSFGLQDNRASSALSASNTVLDNVVKSRTSTDSKNNNKGYDFSNNLLYQHKFEKRGRTISLNVNTQLSERNNNGSYLSQNLFNDTIASGLDQEFGTYGYTKKVSPNLSYTEPLGKASQIQLSYNPSITESKSDKSTYDFNAAGDGYDSFNTNLSNKYTNTYTTQRGGLSYKFQKDKINLTFGADAQQATLQGSQTFPAPLEINQDFFNVLPNLRFNYKFDKTKNLRVNYRSSTNIPNVSQLQSVVDISNPLQVRSGNPALKQTFENSIFMRFGGFNPQTSRNAMIFVNAGLTEDYIGSATYILKNDTVLQGSLIRAGSQLTKPVNLDGYYSGRMFLVYGFPLKQLKSNMNINAGVNYNRTPSIINNALNYSGSYATSGGIYIGSNISENLDFSLGYNGNYTIVKNSEQKQSDNSYFTHTATFKLNWIFWKGVVFNTDISNTIYNGLSQSFNQQYYLWNAYVGYKFGKNKAFEAKVSVFDILNQNRSISRTVTGAYTEDSYTNVLRRYLMFTLTYTLKNFKNGTPPKTDEEKSPFPGGPPPGMRPNRPGGN
ncbi:MAG: TonB-dependent receptor [Bacteroidia bacterium]|nr:TonB-dependent receptor [Bacteroidia bacterium]